MKMFEFKISAPGKVILHGEHAVVYSKTAVATSIDMRTTISFTELPEKSSESLGKPSTSSEEPSESPELNQVIKIALIETNLWLSIPVQQIREFFFDKFNYVSGDHDLLYSRVKEFVQLTPNLPSHKKTSLEAFIYLLIYVTYEEHINLRPFRVQIETEIPIGSGLGSSASFAVSLAACFLHWSRLQNGISADFNTADLEKISGYAFNCEKILHGTPSGIDNSICTFGSTIAFRKGEPIKPILGIANMKIMLVDTRIERSTKTQVERVKELRHEYPAIVDPVLNSIDEISKEAFQVIGKIHELLSKCDSAPENIHKENQKLMALINMNHGLLCALQTSHPLLDKICVEAQSYGLAAKLTGAGGGGYAYILLPSDIESETISQIKRKLFADGFSVALTNISCKGVIIH